MPFTACNTSLVQTTNPEKETKMHELHTGETKMTKEQREEAFRRANPEVGLLSNGKMYRVIDGEYEPVMDSEVEAFEV